MVADCCLGPVYEVGAQFVEQLNYSNPLDQCVRAVWFENERYFLLSTDYEVYWTHTPAVSVKEALFRYGTPQSPGGYVSDQFPVLNLIPGSYHYQPLVEVVDVYVPSTFTPNSVKSYSAILTSNYPIVETGQYFVRAVL